MAAGTVYVDGSFRNSKGQVMVMGRVLLGTNDTIRPRDLGLRTIKSIVFSPWGDQDAALTLDAMGSVRSFRVITGSIGSLDVLDTSTSSLAASGTGNYVRTRALVIRPAGSIGVAANHGGGVRVYIGTVGGSMRASFIAVGA